MESVFSNKARVVLSDGFQIGDIRQIPHSTIPMGWLECNGASLLRTDYPDLFAIIGTTYGTVDGTHFNIPDYRGEFLRGLDHGRGIDTGRVLGTEQLDAFQGHLFYVASDGTSGGEGSLSNSNYLQRAASAANYENYNLGGNSTVADIGKSSAPITDGTNGTPRTAAETRSRNVSVIVIIKVLNIIPALMPMIVNSDTLGGRLPSYYAPAATSLAGYGITDAQSSIKIATFVDQKTSGTHGGASVATTWMTRVFNTTIINQGNFASLSSNQITLPAGTYEFIAVAPGAGTHSKIRFKNITDATVINGPAYRQVSDSSTELTMVGAFAIAGTKVFELQHYFASAVSSYGLGWAINSGDPEVYAQITIKKMG